MCPRITEVHLIEVTPEKFLDSCSPQELYELHHLLDREKYLAVIKKFEDGHYYKEPAGYPDIDDITDPNLLICR